MREFMENLPQNADVGMAFRDLHAKATRLVEDLDALREEEFGEDSGERIVPGTPLLIDWAHSSQQDRTGIDYLTYLSTMINNRPRQLFGFGVYHPHEEAGLEPSRVVGVRDREVVGDYSMERRTTDEPEPGLVVAQLADLGVNHPLLEPLGETRAQSATRLADLPAEDLRRVELVMRGIYDNISIGVLIRDGATPEQAFHTVHKTLVVV